MVPGAPGRPGVSPDGRKHRHDLSRLNPALENLSQIIKLLVISNLMSCEVLFELIYNIFHLVLYLLVVSLQFTNCLYSQISSEISNLGAPN